MHSPSLARSTSGRGRSRRLFAGSSAAVAARGRDQFWIAATSASRAKIRALVRVLPHRLNGTSTVIADTA